uniref:Uncharacterized protein n=1 Tax=Eiseniibacteriota bacterium TaxID=2212470 RepID=A0A832MJC0_UNCEI
MIDDYRARLLKAKDMTGDEASIVLTELSSLIGNVNEEIVDREMAYNRMLNDLLSTPDMTAAKARIRAEASEEYEALLRAKGYLVLLTEMMRALKYRLRSLEAEREAAHNQ